MLRGQLEALDCSQASFCTVPVLDELIIEQAEKLRDMPDVMHIGTAGPARRAAQLSTASTGCTTGVAQVM